MNHHRTLVKFLSMIVLVSAAARGQAPTGFRWVDFKRDATIISNIEHALKDEDYTAIRKIGLSGEFALVMAVRRDPAQPVPFGDMWTVYNLSMKSGELQHVMTGYNMEVKDWIRFQSNGQADLGVVYMDCWECEPASLFTAFHFDPGSGWRARWANEKSPNQPGVVFLITDVGGPYTNEDVDQVFAVVAPPGGIAAVGTWYYSRDRATGKIAENVAKFSVDQSTGKDVSTNLTGAEAKSWELTLCKPAYSPYGLSQGQSTRACKRMTAAKAITSK
jgi:hypothetical protein